MSQANIDANDCWLYAGSIDTKGYGIVSSSNKNHRAHRVMYENMVKPIPEGLVIDHLCRIRSCINPLHLEVVDNVTNVMRGEAPSAKNARKTHCTKGHEFTDKNIWRRNNGWRICKVCHVASRRNRRARYRALGLKPK